MTGDEHYREAERILEQITPTDVLNARDEVTMALAKAQAHATLALAAATVDGAFVHDPYGNDRLLVSEDRSGWGYGR